MQTNLDVSHPIYKQVNMMNNRVFNTGETSKDLKEKYNPEGSPLRKAQTRMLDMLLYIDKICKEQNIPYSLYAGNVLGAVRHGGFIPWDDDVDIVLLRKDHKKLCQYLEKHPHPQYKLQSFRTDHGYVGAWAILRDTKSEYIKQDRVHNARKYRGLQIDLFPYENRIIVPFYKFSRIITNKNHQWFAGKNMGIARFIHCIQFYILHPIFRFFGFFFGNTYIYMHTYGTTFLWNHTKDNFMPFKPIVFEGYTFPGPPHPEAYLIEQYGTSYNELPRETERNHHSAEVRIWD